MDHYGSISRAQQKAQEEERQNLIVIHLYKMKYVITSLYYLIFDPLKGIDRSFELRGESRLNRFVMTNWRLGNFFYFILKGHHHKISKKLKDAA